jgi:prolyl-tRNA synthetase
MKRILFIALVFASFSHGLSQEIDYKLARTGEYVLGVYLFIHADPINEYDFVGKIKKFDIAKSSAKSVESIIKSAKKKFPHFDGMIFKKDFDHVELIKFKTKAASVAGFSVGDEVQYESLGRLIKGVIVDLIPHRERATVKYIDEDGKEKLDGVPLKSLNKIN